MKKHASAVVFAVVFAIFALSSTQHVEAALISDSRIEAQTELVEDTRVMYIEERIKLVQMLLINALELRVDQLQLQLEIKNQN